MTFSAAEICVNAVDAWDDDPVAWFGWFMKEVEREALRVSALSLDEGICVAEAWEAEGDIARAFDGLKVSIMYRKMSSLLRDLTSTFLTAMSRASSKKLIKISDRGQELLQEADLNVYQLFSELCCEDEKTR
jgi:DNA-directed RNA polymerase